MPKRRVSCTTLVQIVRGTVERIAADECALRPILQRVTWTQHYEFTDPLRDLRSEAEEAEQLRSELQRELSPGHVLHGLDPRVVARALPQDEVMVETSDGRVALVHMTWTRRPESAPWPTTKFLESAEHLDSVLEFRY